MPPGGRRRGRQTQNPNNFSDAEVEEAWRAVQNLNKMLPQLRHFARSLTGNPKVQLRVSHQTPSTSGNVITIRPPIGLGKNPPHSRALCGDRDENGHQRCQACKLREVVEFYLFHEIGHVVKASLGKCTPEASDAFDSYLNEWHPVEACSHAAELRAQVPYAPTFLTYATLCNEYLPMLVNVLEDVRVNEGVYDIMPGMRKVFDLNIEKVLEEGIDLGVGNNSSWRDASLESQFTIGFFLIAAGHSIDGRLHSAVVEALSDEDVTAICAQAGTARDSSHIFALGIEAFRVAQQLGFLVVPRCQVAPPISPDNDPGAGTPQTGDGESDGSKGDSDSVPPEDGRRDDDGNSDSGNSGDSPGTAPSGGADDSGDEGDSGDESEVPPADPGSGSDDSDRGSEDPGGPSGAASDDSDDPSDDESASDGSGQEDEHSAGDQEGTAASEGSGGARDDAAAGEPSESGAAGSDADDRGDDDESDAGFLGSSNGAPLEKGSKDSGVDDEVGSAPGVEGDPLADDEEPSDEGSSDELAEDAAGDDDADPWATDGTEGAGHDDGDLTAPPSTEPDDTGDTLPTGTPDDVATAIGRFLMHGNPDDDESDGLLERIGDGDMAELVGEEEGEELPEDLQDLLRLAIRQVLYFDTASRFVAGVEEIPWPHAKSDWRPNPNVNPSDFAPTEALLGQAVLRARAVFDENKRKKHLRNRTSGRVNTRVLGRRAPAQDPRIFQKSVLPGRRDYMVVITGDASGSTDSDNRNAKIKRAMYAQADLLNRLGVPFEMWFHSAWTQPKEKMGSVSYYTGTEYYVYMYPIKQAHEGWNDLAKTKLANMLPIADNLDGHTLEFVRKRVEASTATDKIIMYYTDGEMPAANAVEEKEVLEREAEYCRRRGITLLGVGVHTDSPKHYGMDTVRMDSDEDIVKVLQHLEHRLER